jgi:hypothetical protein
MQIESKKKKKNIDRPAGGGVSYLTAGTPPPCGSDPLPSGACLSRGSPPRRWRAGPTHGRHHRAARRPHAHPWVDARAGEGAGSSAAVFHLSDLTLWTLMFWGGSVFGGSLEEGRGLRKGRGACCGWTPGGAAPHRRRQTRRPRGRNSRRRCCAVLRIGGNAKASRVCPGSWSLNTACFSLGWMLTVDM